MNPNKRIEMYWLSQGRCSLTKCLYFSLRVLLITLTLYATKSNICGCDLAIGPRIFSNLIYVAAIWPLDLVSSPKFFFCFLWVSSLNARCFKYPAEKKDPCMLSSQMDIINLMLLLLQSQLRSKNLKYKGAFLLAQMSHLANWNPSTTWQLKHQPLAIFLFLIGLSGNARSISISISVSTGWFLFQVYR